MERRNDPFTSIGFSLDTRTLDFLSGKAFRDLAALGRPLARLETSAIDAVRDVSAGINSKAIDAVRDVSAGINTSAINAVRDVSVDLDRSLFDVVSGRANVADALARNTRLLESIASRASFAAGIGAQPISRLVAAPNFGATVAASTLPLRHWADVLEVLRPYAGEDVVEEAAADFDTLSDVVGPGDGETWWIARVPFYLQLGFLVGLCQVIGPVLEFVGDVSDADVPPEVESGLEAACALLAVLVIFIEARAEALRRPVDA